MKKISLLVAIALLLAVSVNLHPAESKTINFIPYYAGEDGAEWTYEYNTKYTYPTPASFKVSQTLVEAGKYRTGDFVRPDGSLEWIIGGADANNLYLYENQSGPFSPYPTVVLGVVELDIYINQGPFPGNEEMVVYFTRTAQMVTPAGTFDDLLVYIVFDTNFPYDGNESNRALEATLGMPPSAYNVTRLSVTALCIGEILNIDFDAKTGNLLSEYVLTDTNLSQASCTPLPPTLLFMGSGLLVLVGWRGFKKR